MHFASFCRGIQKPEIVRQPITDVTAEEIRGALTSTKNFASARPDGINNFTGGRNTS